MEIIGRIIKLISNNLNNNNLNGKLNGTLFNFDNNDDVEKCIKANGIEVIKFVNWTTNSLEILNRCRYCKTALDKSFVECMYCASKYEDQGDY